MTDVTQSIVAADRLSVEVGDPGYPQYQALGARRYSVLVFLDGIEQKNVVTADRSQGWLRRYVFREGHFVDDGDRFLTEVAKGTIEFRFRAEGAS